MSLAVDSSTNIHTTNSLAHTNAWVPAGRSTANTQCTNTIKTPTKRQKTVRGAGDIVFALLLLSLHVIVFYR